MKPKTVVTAALLLFVASSVVYLVVKETGGKPEQNSAQSGTTASPTGQGRTAQPAVTVETETADSKVVVYYFHGNVRCMTCRTIEAYAKEAIESGLGDALKDGTKCILHHHIATS